MKKMTRLKLTLSALLVSCSLSAFAENGFDIQIENYKKVEEYLTKATPYQSVLTSEGRFVNLYNPELKPFVQNKLTPTSFAELEKLLRPHLEIQLTSKGFAQAAERVSEGKKDETNYNAIWVRDAMWIFFSMLERSEFVAEEKQKAKRLLTAIWDYYASDAQLNRIKAIIANPQLAHEGTMNVPHIRFDGNSDSLDDVYVNGAPQHWNHRQNDAHGLFLMGVAKAWRNGIIEESDLSSKRVEVLALFPSYFEKIDYANYEDAGAWEEISKVNTSSVAFVLRGFELWQEMLNDPKLSPVLTESAKQNKVEWTPKLFAKLINSGYSTINRNIKLGGESPDYASNDLRYRRADAALFNLIIPSPLNRLTQNDKREIVTIIEKLERPFGVLRYNRDSYQSGNFWIKAPNATKRADAPELTGDASSNELFTARLANLLPNTEAQWFFDSKLAMIRAHLAAEEKDPLVKQQDIYFAQLHLKRALGQVTGDHGHGLIAADGSKVANWLVPESVNTVQIGDKISYLPSPITPLNWAKASLSMALDRVEPFIQG